MPIRRIPNQITPIVDFSQWRLGGKRDPKVFTRTPLGDEQEAEIRWGKASDFGQDNKFAGPGFTITNPNPQPNPNPSDPRDRSQVWTEVKRVTHKKRIQQANEPENYVDVAVIDEITFQTPNGFVKMVLKNPPDSADE